MITVKTLTKITCSAIIMATAPFSFAGDLTIEIKDIRSNLGKLQIAVFDQAEAFKNSDINNLYAAFTLPINDKESSITLHNLPKGDYAVTLFHDENNNNDIEMSSMGIPQEGYGTSNAKGKYDDLSFSEATITIEEKNETTEINMFYLTN